MTIPKRTMAWGTAEGWNEPPAQQEGGTEAPIRYAWRVDDSGVLQAPQHHDPRFLKRHANIGARGHVYVLLFRPKDQIEFTTSEAAAVESLTYLLAGCSTDSRHSTKWLASGKHARMLDLRNLPRGVFDPMRPLRHVSWAPAATRDTRLQLEGGEREHPEPNGEATSRLAVLADISARYATRSGA